LSPVLKARLGTKREEKGLATTIGGAIFLGRERKNRHFPERRTGVQALAGDEFPKGTIFLNVTHERDRLGVENEPDFLG